MYLVDYPKAFFGQQSVQCVPRQAALCVTFEVLIGLSFNAGDNEKVPPLSMKNPQYREALLSLQKKILTNDSNEWTDETLKSRVNFEKTWTDVIVKHLTTSFGTLGFLYLSGLLIVGWIFVNLGLIPGITPFDPYPFSLLLMIVQFSAIFLSIVVLINQNRQGRIAEVRQQIDFEINVRAEHEITKILHMLDELHVELGIGKEDKELEQMKEKIDIVEIKEEIESSISEEEKKI